MPSAVETVFVQSLQQNITVPCWSAVVSKENQCSNPLNGADGLPPRPPHNASNPMIATCVAVPSHSLSSSYKRERSSWRRLNDSEAAVFLSGSPPEILADGGAAAYGITQRVGRPLQPSRTWDQDALVDTILNTSVPVPASSLNLSLFLSRSFSLSRSLSLSVSPFLPSALAPAPLPLRFLPPRSSALFRSLVCVHICFLEQVGGSVSLSVMDYLPSSLYTPPQAAVWWPALNDALITAAVAKGTLATHPHAHAHERAHARTPNAHAFLYARTHIQRECARARARERERERERETRARARNRERERERERAGKQRLASRLSLF